MVAEGNSNQLITDLHAHSENIGFPWPSEHIGYTPTDIVTKVAEMRDEALANGAIRALGGIALTGHDTLRGVHEAVEAGYKHNIVVTPGAEITSRPSKHGIPGPHLIILLPVEIACHLEEKHAWLPRARGRGYIARWTHERGGIVIAAHPRPKGNTISVSYKQLEKRMHDIDPLRRYDGMETSMRCSLDKAQRLAELAKELDLAEIGSSDAHKLKHIGIAATRILGLPDGYTSDDVLTAIRERRTEAVVLKHVSDKESVEGPFDSYIRRFRERKETKKNKDKSVSKATDALVA